MRLDWFKTPAVIARGVTVYTGETGEYYPSADNWQYDDKENLNLYDPVGRQIATFIHDTWLRVEAGPYDAPSENKPTP